MHQTNVNKYFTDTWDYYPDPLTHYKHSSPYALSKKIDKDDHILDVGCGKNLLKHYFNNVIGIDPVYKEADIITTIENFTTDIKFDVAVCLGSINYGTEDIVAAQVKKIVSLLNQKSKIFWRFVPYSSNARVPIFPWTFDKLREYAKFYGYVQQNELREHQRLYAEWIRNYMDAGGGIAPPNPSL